MSPITYKRLNKHSPTPKSRAARAYEYAVHLSKARELAEAPINGWKKTTAIRANTYRLKGTLTIERLAQLCGVSGPTLWKGIRASLMGWTPRWSDLSAAKIKGFLDSVGAPDA